MGLPPIGFVLGKRDIWRQTDTLGEGHGKTQWADGHLYSTEGGLGQSPPPQPATNLPFKCVASRTTQHAFLLWKPFRLQDWVLAAPGNFSFFLDFSLLPLDILSQVSFIRFLQHFSRFKKKSLHICSLSILPFHLLSFNISVSSDLTKIDGI